MSENMHPAMRRRVEQVERQRAYAIEVDLRAAIDELERQAVRVDALVGSSLSDAVVDSCNRFRTALDGNQPETAGGRIIRRFMPERLRDLAADCEATERTLGPA